MLHLLSFGMTRGSARVGSGGHRWRVHDAMADRRKLRGQGDGCRAGRCRAGALFSLVLACAIGGPVAAVAQTVNGTLIDSETERPIPLGLVMMFTEGGDSITATIADEAGRFSITSAEPGDFVLQAAALGYREAPVGVFELGPGGAISIEYRLRPAPLEIERIVVALDRPVVMHHLVRNGFVRRLQRGLGVFITPHDLENAIGRFTTEQVLEGHPGIRVGTVRVAAGGLGLPAPHLGDVVQIQTPNGWCVPAIYIDGIRTVYSPELGITINSVVGRQEVEAIEVYRRPAEVPVEYSQGVNCGVIVVWSKQGPAAGQVPLTRAASYLGPTGVARLPLVSTSGSSPESGETVRMELTQQAAAEARVESPWEGEFVATRGDNLIVRDPLTGRAISMTRAAIPVLQVKRPRPPRYALYRGMLAGSAATLGIGLGLTLLCDWSDCNRSADDQWGPAIGVGLLVGLVMYSRGPGMHWVATSFPDVSVGEAGAGLRWRVPTR